MDNVKKLADFIDQHKTSEKSVDRFLMLLEICIGSRDGQKQEQEEVNA